MFDGFYFRKRFDGRTMINQNTNNGIIVEDMIGDEAWVLH